MSGAKLGLGALAVVVVAGIGVAFVSGGGAAPELQLEPIPAETKDDTVEIRGKARGPEGMGLRLNTEALRLGPPGEDGWRPFTAHAGLPFAGEHALEVALTQGKTTLTSQTLKTVRLVDVAAIEIESPAEGVILNDANVAVRGRIVGPVDMKKSRLTLNGERLEVAGDGSFELVYPVRPGEQKLAFKVTGQTPLEVVRNVLFDATAPHVEIYRPTDAFTVRPVVRFVLRAWDEAPTLTLKLGDLQSEVKTGELWTGDVPVPLGESELSLALSDPAGNTFETTLEVTRVEPQSISSKEFMTAFDNESSSSGRTGMIRALDPDDDVMRLTLMAVCLTKLEWNHSQSAVLALSTWSDQAKLRTLPGKNAPMVGKNPGLFGPLVERVLLALGTAADPANVPVLTEFVSSEHWHLRRGAAAALERIPDVRALKPLAAAFVKETHPLVKAAFQRALERISRHYEPSPQAWLTWATESARLGDPRSPTNMPNLTHKRLIANGIEWHVTARGVMSDKLPLIVLPDMGLDVSTIEPYLRALEDERRVIYLQVPFPREPKFSGNSFTSYPFQKVGSSLAALLKQLQARGDMPATGVSVLGAGHGGWVAATYAQLDPANVKRQILVSTSPTGEAWFSGVREQRANYRAARDMDLNLVGSRLSEPGLKPPYRFNQGGMNAICKFFSVQFANPKDPEIAHVVGPVVAKDLEGETAEVFRGFRPLVGYKWRSFDLFETSKETHTLLVHGSADPFFNDFTREALMSELAPPEDGQLKRELPWLVEVIPNCSRFPWVEQPEVFVETVRAYLDQE